MKLTIEIPDTIEFAARKEAFTFDCARVPADARVDFFAKAAIVGITKAGIDAAANAVAYAGKQVADGDETFAGEPGVAKAARELVEKWMERRIRLGWEAEAGESAVVTRAKAGLRVQVKAGDAKAYKAASPERRAEMVNSAWDALTDAQRDSWVRWAERKLADEAAARKAEAEEIANMPRPDVKL